jgi:hypothetical protein
MVYGELGRYPLDIDIKVRTISFWLEKLKTKTGCVLTLSNSVFTPKEIRFTIVIYYT